MTAAVKIRVDTVDFTHIKFCEITGCDTKPGAIILWIGEEKSCEVKQDNKVYAVLVNWLKGQGML